MPHTHVAPRRVLAAAAVTSLAAAVELAASWSGGSLFLQADALHLIAHLGIFLVLLLPTTQGHDRREDIATSIVLALVLFIAAAVGFEAVCNLAHVAAAPRPQVLLFSLLGLCANLVSAWLFRDPAQRRWSFRAALAHELSDAAMTLAGLLGAGAIALFGLRWVDPLLSLGIAAWLALWAGRLVVRRMRFGPAAWRVEGHGNARC